MNKDYLNSKEFVNHVKSTVEDIDQLQKASYEAGRASILPELEKLEEKVKILEENNDKLTSKIESLVNDK